MFFGYRMVQAGVEGTVYLRGRTSVVSAFEKLYPGRCGTLCLEVLRLDFRYTPGDNVQQGWRNVCQLEFSLSKAVRP